MKNELSLPPQISALQSLRVIFVIQIIVTAYAGIYRNTNPVFFGYLHATVWVGFGFVLFWVGKKTELKEHGEMKFTSLLIILYGFLTTPDFIYSGDLPLSEEEIKISNNEISVNFNKFILLMIIQTILLVFVILSFSKWFNKIMQKIRFETNNHNYKDINSFKYSTIPLIIGKLFLIIAFTNIIAAAEIINEQGRLPKDNGRIVTIIFEVTIYYIASFSHFILILISYIFYYNILNPKKALIPRFEPNPVLFDTL